MTCIYWTAQRHNTVQTCVMILHLLCGGQRKKKKKVCPWKRKVNMGGRKGMGSILTASQILQRSQIGGAPNVLNNGKIHSRSLTLQMHWKNILIYWQNIGFFGRGLWFVFGFSDTDESVSSISIPAPLHG